MFLFPGSFWPEPGRRAGDGYRPVQGTDSQSHSTLGQTEKFGAETCPVAAKATRNEGMTK